MERTLLVRKATAADIQPLVGLMKSFYAEAGYGLDESEASASFSSLLSHAALGGAWIALLGQRPVGHAVLTTRYTMEHGGLSGYVDDLFVENEHRQKGIASRLLQELETECLARGCKALIVEVGRNNPAGLAAYKKLGMKHVDDGRVLYRKLLRSEHPAQERPRQ